MAVFVDLETCPVLVWLVQSARSVNANRIISSRLGLLEDQQFVETRFVGRVVEGSQWHQPPEILVIIEARPFEHNIRFVLVEVYRIRLIGFVLVPHQDRATCDGICCVLLLSRFRNQLDGFLRENRVVFRLESVLRRDRVSS